MKNYINMMILLLMGLTASGQQLFKGQVKSEKENRPLVGVTVQISPSGKVLSTDEKGNFTVTLSPGKYSFLFRSINYKPKQVQIEIPSTTFLDVVLEENTNVLDEVIINTGYQQTSKESLAGSFVQVDHALINRSVSTGILSRLEDQVPGLIFNKVAAGTLGNNSISIRGQNTILANSQPLIVVDNFPYNGNINDINPNDVQSITVLKDAAASSIWGAKAGNGVIVITTNRGGYNQSTKVNFNSTLGLTEKPDLFYYKAMSNADYINTEKRLFSEGYYQSTEQSLAKPALTPVIELLIAKRDGKISPDKADAEIEKLKTYDVRNDYERYLYRTGFNRQYALNIEGGANNHRFYISGGYDQIASSSVGNGERRLTLNVNHTFSFLKNKLELTTGLFYVNDEITDNGITQVSNSSGTRMYPYGRLVDDNGNGIPLSLDYRPSVTDGIESKGLLNWKYNVLDELANADNTSARNNNKFNLGIKYKIIPGLSAEILYQYTRFNNKDRYYYSQDTYYTRNLINSYTSVNTDGSLKRPIPLGGILDETNTLSKGHFLRGSLSYLKNFGTDHSLSLFGGSEINDETSTGIKYRRYGVDQEHASSQIVDYINTYPNYINPAQLSLIPAADDMSGTTNRFISYYSNASYTYKQKYILTASARLDQSNLFGVATNQKGVPLWSGGIAWDMSKESFYKLALIPYLKLRMTFGYSGNVDKSVSAYTTATYNSGNTKPTKLPYADIINPPNPELRWERVKMFNAGIDFRSKNDVLSGSFEFYAKKGIDLIGEAPFPPSSGITAFKGNTASTSGYGFDISLQSQNLRGLLKWRTSLLATFVKDKVTSYKEGIASQYFQTINTPMVGKPLYGIYSYPWAGLEHATGDPLGYLNGKISKDYYGISVAANPENIIYNGSARPLYYGALRNDFDYKRFSLSFNISYSLGYYFRAYPVTYGNNHGLGSNINIEKRWQKPGDENFTNVPSMPAAANANRDLFYTYSDVLVQKADNIRLKDIRLGYELNSTAAKGRVFSSLQLFLYADNIGILWTANNLGLDPDSQTLRTPRSCSLGIRLGL